MKVSVLLAVHAFINARLVQFRINHIFLIVIDMIKKSNKNQNYKVYAIVAPSISGQFRYAKLGQVISGIKALGFFTVVEVALGADICSRP